MKQTMRGKIAAACAAVIMTAGIMGNAATVYASEDTAMGRYVETEITLPGELISYNFNGRVLEDGTIRILGGTEDEKIKVWDSADNGASWEEAFTVPEEYQEQYLMTNAISPNGKIYCNFVTWGEESNLESKTDLIFSRDGELQKKDFAMTETEDAAFVWSAVFLEDERLLLRGVGDKLLLFDTETEEPVQNLNENDNQIEYIQQAGKEVYAFGVEELYLLDYETGEEIEDAVIKTEIEKDSENFVLTSVQTVPIAVTEGVQEGEVYYCSSEGIFRCMQDGNVVEQVVDGKLTSLAKPSVSLCAMQVLADGSLLVLAGDGGLPKIFRYIYDESVPSVPDKELHIYSLNDNAQVQQAASMFQTQNPDYFVNLEVGMSGEDAVTASDALRTLNTEIMAGNGPDILVLDGMPVESYIEKGVLVDLYEVYREIGQSEKLLDNIAGIYASEESVYAIPTRFKVPILQGNTDVLSEITDITSLGETAKQLREQNGEVKSIVNITNIYWFLKEFYSACSPAMVADDGSFNREAVTEFITQMKDIFELSSFDDSETEYRYISDVSAATEDNYRFDVTCLTGEFSFLAKETMLDEINLYGGMSLAYVVSLNDQEGLDYISAPYSGKKVFIPSTVMGVSSRSGQIEGAKEFIKFMLSEKIQSSNQESGFPVNKTALEEEIPQPGTGIGGSSWTYMTEEGIEESISFDVYGPSEEQREKFISMAESLDTPSLTDAVMEEFVLEQAGKAVSGEISVEEAVEAINQKMSLYLAE